MTKTLYTFEDSGGTEDAYTTTDLGEAEAYAQRARRVVIARDYEPTGDPEIVADYADSYEAAS